MKPDTCKHGWNRAYLETARDECQRLVNAWIAETTHPFRAAGLAGARKSLRTVESHITECSEVST
jgi:hypothetical protein